MRPVSERCDMCKVRLHAPSEELGLGSTAFCPICRATHCVVVVKHPETGVPTRSWKYIGRYS